MTKKITNTAEPTVITVLNIPKEGFKKVLLERIKIGEEIFNRNIQTENQFEQAQYDYESWDNFNSKLLKQSFNEPNNECKNDYERCTTWTGSIATGGPISPSQKLKDFKEKIKLKVDELKNLKRKT